MISIYRVKGVRGASEIFSSFAECNAVSLAKGVLTESQSDCAEDSRTGTAAEE